MEQAEQRSAKNPVKRIIDLYSTPGMRRMVVGGLFFSLMAVQVKILGEVMPTQQLLFVRSLIVFVASAWTLRNAGISFIPQNKKLLLLRSIFGFTAMSSFFFALPRLPLADLTLITFLRPLFISLLAAKFLREAFKPIEGIALASGFLGVIIMARPTFLFGGSSAETIALDPVGLAAALTGAVFSAAAHVTIRGLRHYDHAYRIVFYFSIFAGVVSFPQVVLYGVWPVGWQWGLLLGIGLAAHLGQVQLTKGLQMEKAGRAASVGYLQIVLAYFWGLVIFGEIPTLGNILGALFIIASIAAVGRFREPTSATA